MVGNSKIWIGSINKIRSILSSVDMEQRIGHEIHLKQYPRGLPTEDDFEIVEVNIPEPKEGEFLVRNIWMSVDPYMRGRMRGPDETKSYVSSYHLNKPLKGSCIGQIIESKNAKFNPGEYLLGNFGWRDYWISDGDDVMKVNSEVAPIQSYLSVLGMTGFTAYIGLMKIGKLNEGKDTVFISAASGAVGSIACQIAKIKGCHVVGSAGKDEKVDWLLDEIKLDYAFNYNNVDESELSKELKSACPEGIDLYFDNVGGKQYEAALNNIKLFGRIVLCGMISQYNDEKNHITFSSNLFLAIKNRIRIEGFIVLDHYELFDEFQSSMSEWIKDGRVKWKETIVSGLENAPKSFIGLFKGDNFGKMLIKIGD